MVGFAGYSMPVQYAAGVKAEHLHTRSQAGLFDVSHMGQVLVRGDGRVAALEKLVPGNIAGLKTGRTRYSVLTNEAGGILDDLMITNRGQDLYLVVNAARKDHDIAHIQHHLGSDTELEVLSDRALVALQGPKAAVALARMIPGVEAQIFMSFSSYSVDGEEIFVTRSGYTGEDGFELSIPTDIAAGFCRKLLDQPEVMPIGLGARDSLRLEAGLCLYGHDLDPQTTPIEADLAWVVGKRRREDGGFLGAEVILQQIADGPGRLRVGIRPDGKAPAREGTQILGPEGEEIGIVTSGGFGPTVEGPIAMGYVAAPFATPGSAVQLLVRGKARAATIVEMPFTPHRYHRG
jgi:aminomethyltransferase